MSVFNEEFGIAGMVSHTTVSDWMKTAGLAFYKEACGEIRDSKSKYAFVIDESITIGSQKLLLVLAIPSEHQGHALTHKDVKVVGMFVAASWKSEDISEKLQGIIDDITYAPEYILSDNGGNLVKATELLGVLHHKDISHTLGIILKKRYAEDADFNNFTSEMGKARLRYHLTDKAYLLPPNQRSISRFMNCFEWVEWGNRMLNVFSTLTDEQKEAFAFIPKHKQLLRELSCVMECYKHVMKRVKNEGLSRKLFVELRSYIIKRITPNNLRLSGVMAEVWGYLKAETEKLKQNELTHNISSDIIESTFGVFKDRKSPNHLYGVTPFVLFIPAHAKVVSMNDCTSIDFKRIFSAYHNQDTELWKAKHLLTNWVVERSKKLRKVG